MTTVQDVYDELKRIEKKMVTRDQIQSLVDTIEIMGNPDTMEQISSSLKDIEKGRTKEVSSVQDMLDEM